MVEERPNACGGLESASKKSPQCNDCGQKYRYLVFTSMLKIASLPSSVKTGNTLARVEGVARCMDQTLSESDCTPITQCHACLVGPWVCNQCCQVKS